MERTNTLDLGILALGRDVWILECCAIRCLRVAFIHNAGNFARDSRGGLHRA